MTDALRGGHWSGDKTVAPRTGLSGSKQWRGDWGRRQEEEPRWCHTTIVAQGFVCKHRWQPCKSFPGMTRFDFEGFRRFVTAGGRWNLWTDRFCANYNRSWQSLKKYPLYCFMSVNSDSDLSVDKWLVNFLPHLNFFTLIFTFSTYSFIFSTYSFIFSVILLFFFLRCFKWVFGNGLPWWLRW